MTVNLGRHAEDLAAAHMARAGWVILARNYRAGPKEIDIIARRGHTIAFIEVKARAQGDAAYTITGLKRRHLAYAAQRWLNDNPDPTAEYRFDAITVCFKHGKQVIEHYENAWTTT